MKLSTNKDPWRKEEGVWMVSQACNEEPNKELIIIDIFVIEIEITINMFDGEDAGILFVCG
jgi:hypothetical protein